MEFRFDTVSERDMGLLFLEELSVNERFLNLFLKEIEHAEKINLSGYQICSAEVSYFDPELGESDLTILLAKENHRIALLIENKISAPSQPRQYERYNERGSKAVQQGQYELFFVFLIAPKDYITGNASASKYPYRVTYEACRDLFLDRNDARSQLKAQQITQAIRQVHKPYTKIVDSASTHFWDQYVAYMYTHYPEICLRSNVRTKSKNGDWPTYWTALDMKQVYIHHKMNMKGVDYSYIDLTFNNLAEHRVQLEALLKNMLGENYDPRFSVQKAGKSAVLRLVAPKSLDWQKPFEAQIDIVDTHLRLVSKLCSAAKQMDRAQLQAFYTEVTGQK